jgi:hypothetical protein
VAWAKHSENVFGLCVTTDSGWLPLFVRVDDPPLVSSPLHACLCWKWVAYVGLDCSWSFLSGTLWVVAVRSARDLTWEENTYLRIAWYVAGLPSRLRQ